METTVDTAELGAKVKDMYRLASRPQALTGL
jgi:hypothetical protein